MQTLKYYLRDAKEGVQRNAKASIATILLIFISLSITGSLFLLKTSVDDVLSFLNDQVKIKVFVDPNIETNKVEEILKEKSFVKSTSVETKEETLNELKQFFEGKEYLFLAFKESQFPDAIVLELNDKKNIELIAGEIKKIDGITDVIYAQEFAEMMLSWTERINKYGMIILSIFLISSFLTVSIAINLAMFQRQKDIRVKLLLGAKEQHVRGQFLFEGWLLGLIASLFSTFVIYLIYHYALYQLEVKFSQIFYFSDTYLNAVMLAVVISGSLIGLLGSFFSTRKLIQNA